MNHLSGTHRSVHPVTQILMGAWLALALGACTSIEDKQAELASLTDQGKFVEAKAVAFDPKTHDVYEGVDSKNFLLLRLERGSTALSAGDYDDAVAAFDEAQQSSAFNYEMKTWDSVLQWINNDGTAAYYARPHEDIYVSALSQAASLAKSKLENGAIVDANRQLDKVAFLNAQYATVLDQIKQQDKDNQYAAMVKSMKEQSQSGAPQQSAADGGQTSQRSGMFLNSPLGMYLSTITFAHAGIPDKAELSASQFNAALADAPDGGQRLEREAFSKFGSQEASVGNLVVVALSGRAPEFGSRALKVPVLDQVLPASVPVLRPVHSDVSKARVEVRGGNPVDLHLVEDMAAVVAENFRRSEDAIYYRAAIRMTVKAGIVTAGTIVVSRNDDRGWWTSVTGALGAGWIYLTERADRRSWTTLPAQARVALLRVSPGEHEVRVVFTNATDVVLYEGPWTKVAANQSGVTAVVARSPR
ncbi:MAG: hypothetical protein HEQ23_07050 [Tepidisphaera sp.]